MSPLVGFKSQNHPQQTALRGARDVIDDRGTDPELFARLNQRFNFNVDVAAADHNAKLVPYFTIVDNGLEQSWAGWRVWCNPPYSAIEPWVEKAWSAAAELVVMLLPANRTEQGWWQRRIEPFRDLEREQPVNLRVEFLPGRPRFVLHSNGDDEIKPNQRPPFGLCLAIWTVPSWRRDQDLAEGLE